LYTERGMTNLTEIRQILHILYETAFSCMQKYELTNKNLETHNKVTQLILKRHVCLMNRLHNVKEKENKNEKMTHAELQSLQHSGYMMSNLLC
jgi:uncharacterized coiled-coil DUF342 family protein